MPDKLVAVLFYWSLNAKSSEFLLSSPVCDFQPKHGLKQLFLVTLLSDLDQSNLRRGYDGKCRNCPRVWFEGSGGMPG